MAEQIKSMNREIVSDTSERSQGAGKTNANVAAATQAAQQAQQSQPPKK